MQLKDAACEKLMQTFYKTMNMLKSCVQGSSLILGSFALFQGQDKLLDLVPTNLTPFSYFVCGDLYSSHAKLVDLEPNSFDLLFIFGSYSVVLSPYCILKVILVD